MAQVLVAGAGDGLALVDDRPLIRTLAALPERWTLLVDRCIGEGPASCIKAVLVHPEVGVALVDEAPCDAFLARAALRQLLRRERFSDYFPGELPIVAVTATAESSAAIGEQLAAAFGAAPRLSLMDPDWAYAVIELILESSRLDAAVEQQTVETADAELAFRTEFAPRVSSRIAGSGEMVVATDRKVGNALSPHRVQLVPFVPVWLPAIHDAPRVRSRRVMAAKWAGLGAAVLAVAWGFGDRLEHTPRLQLLSPVEVETTAVPPSAMTEPVAFGGEARTELQRHDGPVVLPRSARVDSMANAAPSALPSDAAARPTAERAKSGRAKSHASRAKRASPPGPADHATARRAGEGSVASATIDRSAPIPPPHIVCADWLHQDRPGGSDYRGPPVAACPRKR